MDQVLETRGLVVPQNEIGNNQGAPGARSMPGPVALGCRRPRGGSAAASGSTRISSQRSWRQPYRRESMCARANHARLGHASLPASIDRARTLPGRRPTVASDVSKVSSSGSDDRRAAPGEGAVDRSLGLDFRSRARPASRHDRCYGRLFRDGAERSNAQPAG